LLAKAFCLRQNFNTFKFTLILRVLIIGLLFLFINSIVGQKIFYLNFNEDQFTQTAFDQISQKNLILSNHFDRPEKIESQFGMALRLDGWSTFASTNEILLSDINDAISFEAWYATESFNQNEAALFDYSENNNDLFIAIDPYGNINFTLKINGKKNTVVSASKIQPYMWHHIVCTADPAQKSINIYMNGVLDKTMPLTNIGAINSKPSKLLIGKRNINKQIAGFDTNILNGALDEISIYNTALTYVEVLDKFNAFNSNRKIDLAIDPNLRHGQDYLRPKYHIMPNTAWANESYGLIFYKEKYHMFFQKNPNAPSLNFMHWGHFSSDDLVNWKEEMMPLRPEEGFASAGVWSGCTFLDNDEKPVIAYTGVNGLKAAIGIAYSQDENLNKWTTQATNPVIKSAPPTIPNQDFRDPYVWKENNIYYMIVGSGVKNNGGGILFTFTSTDLKTWTNVLPIYKNSSISTSGIFWEMPSFSKLNDHDYMLAVTPVFNGTPATCIYWIGSFDGINFKPYDDVPKQFEPIGGRLLSPAIGKDENNQLTYIGIIPEDRSVEDQIKSGWRQTFSIPRILEVNDSKILHKPHPNLCNARSKDINIYNRKVLSNTSQNLTEYIGNQSEFEFIINSKNTKFFNIDVFKNNAANEFTSIIFDKRLNKIGINRYLSSPYNTTKDYKTADYKYKTNDSIYVRIFIDHSILEVFVDNEIVLSCRVYPSINSQNIDIVAIEGELEIVSFKAWDIIDKERTITPGFCDVLNIKEATVMPKNDNLKIYPNPVNDDTFFIKIIGNSFDKLPIIQLHDEKGNAILFEATKSKDNTILVHLLDKMHKGVIIGSIQYQNIILETFKVLFIH
jgi:beta-fructofuranosidase